MILSLDCSIESLSTMVSKNGEPYGKIGRGDSCAVYILIYSLKIYFCYVAKNGFVALHLIYIKNMFLKQSIRR